MSTTNLSTVAVNISTSGDTALVAGLPGRRVVVSKALLVAGGTVSVSFKGSGGSTLCGGMPLPASGNGLSLPYDGVQYFATAPGEGLVINLSASVAVGGVLLYEYSN